MIKIQSAVKDLVLNEPEAQYALLHGFMNMSGYAGRIHTEIEKRVKKSATRTSIVVALARIRSELKRSASLTPKVSITNITTKLPLSEIVYENTSALVDKLESLHKKIKIPKEDFFTSTIGTAEINIICSSNNIEKIIKNFPAKPKLVLHNLAAVGVSFDSRHINIPNTIFSLVSVLARARVNLVEIVSTYTELTFIVAQKDFNNTVFLLSGFANPEQHLR